MNKTNEAVSVGVLLPTREARVRGRDDPAALLDLAEQAELRGFDSLWVGDSPIARPRFDPLTLLAAVAARVERIALGTAVYLAALRPPVVTAHALASLDHLAGGRLIVGLGTGFPLPATEAEFAATGVPFKQRVGRLVETVAIWRALWASTEGKPEAMVDFTGRYWQFEAVELLPKPSQRGGPPLWLAGSAPPTLKRVGASFDGWLPYPATPGEFAAQLGTVRAAADEAGRQPEEVTPALYATVALEDDNDRAQAMLADYVTAYYGLPIEVMRQVQAFHGGDDGSCTRWLAEYIAAGARHIVLRFATLDDPAEMMGRASETIIPALRKATEASAAEA